MTLDLFLVQWFILKRLNSACQVDYKKYNQQVLWMEYNLSSFEF